MKDQDELKDMMRKLIAASPFVIWRYMTLHENTTLEGDSKLAFANVHNMDQFREDFFSLREHIDAEFTDYILGSDEDVVLPIIDQLAVIFTVVGKQGENAFLKKQLFDFAVELRLYIDDVDELEDLDTIHQAALSYLATKFGLFDDVGE